jgi:CRISPR/Cas system-associated exonuclease Cas4 (RecB family)
MNPFGHWQAAVHPRDIPAEVVPEGSGLPPAFQFSQQSLQDYADCPRRFQLKYVLGQQWPAVEAEPITRHERFIEQGAEFHLLIQRHLLGIPAEKLTPRDPVLARWWDAYLRYPPPDLSATQRMPEILLSTPLGGQRLMARFDLLAIEPGVRAVIVDWKTTRHRTDHRVLAGRLQTKVYPFVLVEAGTYLFGKRIEPEQVSLTYWFAEAPQHPETFHYETAQHEDNRAYLTQLIAEVIGNKQGVWPLTADTDHCRYCLYRSLCERGERAGYMDEGELDNEEDEFNFEFDLGSAEEIAF